MTTISTLTEIYDIASFRRDCDVSLSSSLTKIAEITVDAIDYAPDAATEYALRAIQIVALCGAPAFDCMSVIARIAGNALRDLTREMEAA